MLHISEQNLKEMPRVKRLNIVNAITGVKPANLIGTVDRLGNNNCAIFSSVIHLGSDPALIGFIARPAGEARRHTIENIEATGCYTINAIPETLIQQGHYTSAKFDSEVDEFERCAIDSEYAAGFNAPFVKSSPLKMGVEYLEQIPIERNGTSLVIGCIKHIFINEAILGDKGYINLEIANICGVGGLNSYYRLEKIKDLPYARASETPSFD